MADDCDRKKRPTAAAGLLDSDEEGNQQDSFLSINKKFAKEYEARKQKHELARFRELHGSDYGDGGDDNEEDESSSSEDDEGDLLNTKLDIDFMKTLNALRNKSDEIYNPSTQFFKEPSNDDVEEEDDDDNSDLLKKKRKEKKDKRKTYKDIVREQILQDMEKEDEDGSVDREDDAKTKIPTRQLAYDEEQRKIRQAFLQSTKNGSRDGGDSDHNDKDDDDDSSDDFMVVKRKVKGGTADDDSDNNEFLEQVKKMEESLKKRRDKGGSGTVDPKGEVEDGDKFLLDFFKNRSWVDQKNGATNSSSDDDDNDDDNEDDAQLPMKSTKSSQDKDLDEDDDSLDQLDKNDDFEARYNFRFEAAQAAGSQSGAEFSNISYARGTTMDTMRRKDDSRAQKRQARKERKEAERRAKEEQLKRLKNAKRKEMELKLQEIKKVLGQVEEDGDVDEAAIMKMMEGDYDPEKLDQLMGEAFGDDYYNKSDAQWKSDQDVRKDLEQDEEGVVGEKGDGNLYDEDNEDEYGEEGDAGDNEEEEEEEWVEEEEFNQEHDGEAEMDQRQPETELEKKLKSKIQDELYKLDYEDIVAGIPTRFKYRQVEANNYGLTTEDILFARDTSLRQYVSLKKMAPYRQDGEYVVGRKKRRLFREMLQQDSEDAKAAAAAHGQAKKTNKGTSEETQPSTNDGELAFDKDAKQQSAPEQKANDDSAKKKKRRRKKKGKGGDESDKQASTKDTETEAATQGKADEPSPTQDEDPTATVETKKKRRRRRRRSDKNADETADDVEETKDEMVKLQTETPIKESSKKITTKAAVDLHKAQVSCSGQNRDSITNDHVDKPKHSDENEGKDKSKRSCFDKKKRKRPTGSTHDQLPKKEYKTSKKLAIEGMTASRLSSYGL